MVFSMTQLLATIEEFAVFDKKGNARSAFRVNFPEKLRTQVCFDKDSAEQIAARYNAPIIADMEKQAGGYRP